MSFSIGDRELDFNKWKVADLRKELKNRGLSIDGKKNELVERLQMAVGDSTYLEDTATDQDEILDEDVLTDDEAFEEDSELAKADTPDSENREKDKVDLNLKRKAVDNSEYTAKAPKKVILNRNVSAVDTSKNNVNEPSKDKENQVEAAPESSTEKKTIVRVGALSPQERLERRAAKFGVAMSNEAKKEARAARFGLPTAASKIGGLVNTNIDVLKKRAERFGTTLPGSILESAEIEERRKKREERFGKVEVTVASTPVKGKFNLQRSAMEEKKKLRAERFKTK